MCTYDCTTSQTQKTIPRHEMSQGVTSYAPMCSCCNWNADAQRTNITSKKDFRFCSLVCKIMRLLGCYATAIFYHHCDICQPIIGLCHTYHKTYICAVNIIYITYEWCDATECEQVFSPRLWWLEGVPWQWHHDRGRGLGSHTVEQVKLNHWWLLGAPPYFSPKIFGSLARVIPHLGSISVWQLYTVCCKRF